MLCLHFMFFFLICFLSLYPIHYFFAFYLLLRAFSYSLISVEVEVSMNPFIITSYILYNLHLFIKTYISITNGVSQYMVSLSMGCF